jgi:GAF domain-containing protein
MTVVAESRAARGLAEPGMAEPGMAEPGLAEPGLASVLASVAESAGMRMGAAGLVLGNRILTLASVGLSGLAVETGGVPIEWAPSGLATGAGEAVRIDDLRSDFPDLPMAAMCDFRSYASVSLRNRDGVVVGALAVMDPDPGRLPPGVTETLTDAAAMVMGLLSPR